MALLTTDQVFSLIEKNISRSNRFSFTINLPSISEVQKYNSKENKDLLFAYIQDAKLPGVNLTIKESVFMGVIKQTIIKQTPEGITLTIYDTKEQILRKMFVAWFNAITPKDKFSTLKYYPNQYTASAEMVIENAKFKINGMIPSSVGDFNASQLNKDSIGIFNVIFKIKNVEEI